MSKLSYTIKEYCEASGLGKTTVYAKIASGDLKVVKIGNRTLITAESAHALLQAA